jgi:hypothetical protein
MKPLVAAITSNHVWPGRHESGLPQLQLISMPTMKELSKSLTSPSM